MSEPNDLQVLQMVGRFSQKNQQFINGLKKAGVPFKNSKGTKKNIVEMGTCKVVFNYDNLQVQQKGDCGAYQKAIDGIK